MAFLALQVSELTLIDFFVVPTGGLKVIFVLIILGHGRRRVLHANVTEHPTADWTAQQLVEAFPFEETPRYLVRDRDAIYGEKVRRQLRACTWKRLLPHRPRRGWRRAGFAGRSSRATCENWRAGGGARASSLLLPKAA
jgi:putative transposase